MDKKQFDILAEFLYERGYKRYNQHWHNEDYVIGKGFHKEDNVWEEDRSAKDEEERRRMLRGKKLNKGEK